LDFVLVTGLIFFLWLAAKKTKKLLKRLEPEEKLATREMIIIKASLNGIQNTHLVNEEAPAAEPETAVAAAEAVMEPGVAFEVEPLDAEPEEAILAAAGSKPWEEFSWEPGEAVEVAAR
jgi:hypothetical protein